MDVAERLRAQLSPRAHYRIPRRAYAALALAGVVAMLVAFTAGAPIGVAAPIGIVGAAMPDLVIWRCFGLAALCFVYASFSAWSDARRRKSLVGPWKNRPDVGPKENRAREESRARGSAVEWCQRDVAQLEAVIGRPDDRVVALIVGLMLALLGTARGGYRRQGCRSRQRVRI